jgi:uncharacterized RDD family membrane protein YckC
VIDAHRSGDRGGSSEPARLASFGRRLAAFILDMLLLSVIGEVVRAAFSDPLSQIGEYGRLVEWTCAIAYFGCFESRWGRGQSIGKRLLGLCVVRPDNTFPSPVEAGLRAAIATAPLIFNHMRYRPPSLIVGGFVGGLLGVALIGMPLSVLYLVAISSNKRRPLLHDLAFNTSVVRHQDCDIQRPPPLPTALWRGHFVVVSLILLASFLAFLAMSIFAVLDRVSVSSGS